MSITRRGLRWSMLIVVVALALFGFFHYVCGIGRPHHVFSRVGSIQVLANQTECWLFAEESIFLEEPGLIPRDHGAIEVDIRQSVTVFSRAGPIRRISVPRWKEVTLSPNLSRVFRLNGRFYLLGGDSHRDLFEWDEDHFRRLPRAVSEPLLTDRGIGDRALFDGSLDRLTEQDGWKHLTSERGLPYADPTTFTWGDTVYTLDVIRTPSGVVVRLSPSVHERGWESEVMVIDNRLRKLTQEEYDRYVIGTNPASRKR